MLNKYSFIFITLILLFSTVSIAQNEVKVETSFNELLECMKTIPLDPKKYQGNSSQQILLLSVLKNFTNDSNEVKQLGLGGDLNIDYPKLYKLVSSHCPKELAIIKKLNSQKQG